MSRNRLFWIAGGLAVAATASLIFGITLLHKNIASYIASHYHEYSRDANAAPALAPPVAKIPPRGHAHQSV